MLAWIEAIEAFVSLVAEADTTDPTSDESEDGGLVPQLGVGQAGEDDAESTDRILHDMTFWAELLVGLEATDPTAVRRFRSAAIRLRQRLDHSPAAPSILAENSRRLLRAEYPEDDTTWLTQDTLESSPITAQGLPAEFSDRKHVRGVLSAARMGHDINSASCQFFVMHATYPSLDGKYTLFGKLVSGEEVIDAIVNSPRDLRTNKPKSPHTIISSVVVRAPAAQD